jgi:hypothetical protein
MVKDERKIPADCRTKLGPGNRSVTSFCRSVEHLAEEFESPPSEINRKTVMTFQWFQVQTKRVSAKNRSQGQSVSLGDLTLLLSLLIADRHSSTD